MTEFARLNYDLHYAILSNSLSLVTYYLENGASSSEPSPAIEKETLYSQTMFIQAKSDQHRIYPIHVAIINYYHRMKGIDQEQNYASKIIDALIRHGADLDSKCTNITFLHVGIYDKRDQSQPLTPLALLSFLRQTPTVGHEKYCIVMLDTLAEVMMKTKTVMDREKRFQLPSSPVPKCTQRVYSNLYLSEKHSDVQFHCPGGVVLHAHKCVLATSSKYFDIAFAGEWQESDGKWETTNPPEVMKAVLAFMYTGATLETYGAVNMRKLYQVASEYQLNALCQLCEQWCVDKISVNNFRDMLLLAHLHNAKKLKEACYTFVKDHPQVLLEDGVLQIQTDNPELWTDLKHGLKRKL